MTPAPLFTPEQVREDAQNKVVRTTGQSGAAVAAIGVGTWVAHQFGWHGELDAATALNMSIVLTAAAAAVTNLRKLRAK
jgi:predicted MFS family arabinose efflux permease